MMPASYLAFLAVISMATPIVTGPAPKEAGTITAQLCGGGEITIPLGNGAPAHKPDCHKQACHAGACREKMKKPAI